MKNLLIACANFLEGFICAAALFGLGLVWMERHRKHFYRFEIQSSSDRLPSSDSGHLSAKQPSESSPK